jgi:hypothetical protein
MGALREKLKKYSHARAQRRKGSRERRHNRIVIETEALHEAG